MACGKKPYISPVALVYMQCSEASTRRKGLEQVVSPYKVWLVSPLLLQLSCLILPVWDIFLCARGVIGLQWCCLPVSRLWICRSAERRALGHQYIFIRISEIRAFLMKMPKRVKIFSRVLSNNPYSKGFAQARVISAMQLSPTLRRSTALQSHL